MRKVQIPDKFGVLFQPFRFKVFYGGRGGAKSRSFARVLLLMAAEKPLRILCAREVQKSIRDSVKRLLDDEIKRLGLAHKFYSTDTEIRGTNGSLFIFAGLRQHNAESIKSYEGINIVWIEEAETVSERSMDLLIPTIREEGSEIWISYNPERINGAVHKKFVINEPPPRSVVVKVGWEDNPWFPDVLREEMEQCRANDPEKYAHIWGGEAVLVAKGSYYGRCLQKAEEDGRITPLLVEPTLLVHTAWDLGMADSTAIWFFQHMASGPSKAGEYRIVDYYEASGEGLAHYASVLEQKKYNYGKHIAPHDIKVRELGSGKSRYEKAEELGIRFDIAPNIPVMDGIEAVRDVIDAAWFDKKRCGTGLECLWGYQREWDDVNACFKSTPKHDWTSHGADALRYLAVGFRPPVQHRQYEQQGYNSASW